MPPPTPRPFLTFRDLPDHVWERVEDRLGRFEAAWQKNERPDPAVFLVGVSGEERDTLLVELVHEDLEYRLRAGEPARVEEYLERFPELHGRDDTILDLLAMESFLREAVGAPPTEMEHRQRFPQHADTLPARIDLLRARAGAPLTVSLDNSTPPQTATVAPAGRAPRATNGPAGLSTRVPDPAETPPSFLPVAQPILGVVSSSVLRIAVPGYEILGLLGRGGMGVVLQARQLSLGRLVALKIIRDAALAGEQDRRRFRAEAEAIARLQHPNVIHVYDVGDHDGLLHMALEYCPGGSLAARLGGKPLQAADAASLVEALARGIHAAHMKGVIHRDLKPGNVLLAEDGTPKITDFGLVKRLDMPGETSLGVVLGTPSYMAPEQAAGQIEIGPAVDIYALGAVLYELLTGRPPFRAASTMDTVLQVLGKEPTPPSQLNAAVPPALEAICLRCLLKAPEDRFSSALELAEALRQFQQVQATDALPMAQPLTSTTSRQRWAKSGRKVGSFPGGAYGWAAAVMACVLLLAIVGGLVYSMIRNRGQPVAQGDPPTSTAPVSPRSNPPPPPTTRPEAVRVRAIDVRHVARSGKKVQDMGLLGTRSFETRKGDSVLVTARLSHPAYAYVIAFRPDGTEDLCFPDKPDEVPPLIDTPRYPWKDPAEEYFLDEGVGLAMFAVVASSHPLPPYREWKANHGPAKWGQHEAQSGVVLWYDGASPVERLTEDDSGPSRAKREAADKAPVVRLVDSLRGPDVETVAGIGFAVLAKRKH
jgi:serine/threonine protein kinase